MLDRGGGGGGEMAKGGWLVVVGGSEFHGTMCFIKCIIIRSSSFVHRVLTLAQKNICTMTTPLLIMGNRQSKVVRLRSNTRSVSLILGNLAIIIAAFDIQTYTSKTRFKNCYYFILFYFT